MIPSQLLLSSSPSRWEIRPSWLSSRRGLCLLLCQGLLRCTEPLTCPGPRHRLQENRCFLGGGSPVENNQGCGRSLRRGRGGRSTPLWQREARGAPRVWTADPSFQFTTKTTRRQMGSTDDSDSNPDDRDSSSNGGVTEVRRQALHASLRELHLDAAALEDAVRQSLERPTEGYDGRFGKSAVKAYRSFVYPKRAAAPLSDCDDVSLAAAAGRVARQIEFLWKRHRSHQVEWVRHHDAASASASASPLSSSSPQGARFPLVLVLDNLRSAWNVGSLFRTADAAGCDLVLTAGISPHPGGGGSDKLAKTALGAQDVVPHRHFPNLAAALQHARTAFPNYEIVALETTQRSVPYTAHDFASSRGTVLVVGNEVTGVNADLMDREDAVDAIVEVPMYGTKNSLNVAACTPIVLYEIIRQREGKIP